jgi:hypothetical protein
MGKTSQPAPEASRPASIIQNINIFELKMEIEGMWQLQRTITPKLFKLY